MRKPFRAVIAPLLLALFTGCIVVPVPAPRKNIGPGQAQNKLDLDFLRDGATSRLEVQDKVGWTDVGYQHDRLFWGRWITSGMIWVAGIGNGYAGAVGAERNWAGRNLFVEFDQNRVVKAHRVFPDGDLILEISAWLAREPRPLELLEPKLLHIEHRHKIRRKGEEFNEATLSLESHALDFREPGNASHDFRLPVDAVRSLSIAGGLLPCSPSPNTICLSLALRQKTKAGKILTFRIPVRDALDLVQYLRQVRPQAVPVRNSQPQASQLPVL